jgi:hypothetical protein
MLIVGITETRQERQSCLGWIIDQLTALDAARATRARDHRRF